MTDEQLLAEIEELLRAAPSRTTILDNTTENLSWLGRMAAVLKSWKREKWVDVSFCLNHIHSFITANAAPEPQR